MTSTCSAATAVPNRLLTRREASAFLAISQRKLDQLTASGELRRLKFSACVRFDLKDLNTFIAAAKEGN